MQNPKNSEQKVRIGAGLGAKCCHSCTLRSLVILGKLLSVLGVPAYRNVVET